MDRPIQKFQTRLYAAIKDEFCFGDDDYQSYGRVYRNQQKDGYIAEAYNNDGDYIPVTYNDTNKMQSFFGIGDNSRMEGSRMVTPVHLVFHADLCKIYSSVDYPHRPDEELRTTITNIIRSKIGFGFELIELIRGIDKVFAEYPGTDLEKMAYTDIHPLHCFRFNFDLTHYPDEDLC